MNIDVTQVAVVVTVIIIFNFRVRPFLSRSNLLKANAGLLLLLFTAIMDFTDGIRSLDNVPILGNKAPYHDILEDQFFYNLGLILFCLGVFKALVSKKDG